MTASKMSRSLPCVTVSNNHCVYSQQRVKTIYLHATPRSKSLPLQYVYMAKLPSLYKTSMFPCHTSVAFLFRVVCFPKWSHAYLSKTQYGLGVTLFPQRGVCAHCTLIRSLHRSSVLECHSRRDRGGSGSPLL